MEVGTMECVPSGVEGEVLESIEASQSSFPLSLREWITPHSAVRIPFLSMKCSLLLVLKKYSQFSWVLQKCLTCWLKNLGTKR